MHHGELHHLGVTVANLDASLAWYRGILAIEPELVAEGAGRELGDVVGATGVRNRFAFLRVGDAGIELLQFTPSHGSAPPRLVDVGACHVCVRVDDIHASYRDLLARGAEFVSPPWTVPDGPAAGLTICFLRAPDGLSIELLQEPADDDARSAR